MSSQLRRSQRNAETPKKEVKDDEEPTVEKIGRRRSLRHSPTGTSPPTKIPCRRLSPTIVKETDNEANTKVLENVDVNKRNTRSLSKQISNAVNSTPLQSNAATTSEESLTDGNVSHISEKVLPTTQKNNENSVIDESSRSPKQISKRKFVVSPNGISDEKELSKKRMKSIYDCAISDSKDNLGSGAEVNGFTPTKRYHSDEEPTPVKRSKTEDEEVISQIKNLSVDNSSMESETSLSKDVLQLFEDCMLTAVQRDEIRDILPSNFSEFSMSELIESLMKKLLTDVKPKLSMTSPRFSKFLRSLLNIFCSLDCSIEKKHLLCKTALNWAKERNTINLTHELELAVMQLYYNTKFYKEAEQTAIALYNATKKLQDVEKVVQACLCLSQVYHVYGNISKARANITTAKTEALKIYIVPDLQAELDLQSGIMQIAEEKDMETAFSYFKEAATGFSSKKKRSRALKYMLLSKLLLNKPDEGEKLIQNPHHLPDIDSGVEALVSVTKSAISASVDAFKKSLEKYKVELEEDAVVKKVIEKLYKKMLEKNLINIIQPYNRLQISFIAEKIGLDRCEVELQLSQLILDGGLKAQLDHGDDCLYIYDNESPDEVYANTCKIFTHLDKTLTLLSKKAKQLL